MLKDKRIRIIVGHYGSGKTEFSVNYATKLAVEGRKVAIADLDVVNPYFRSREKQELLENKGIMVIGSSLGLNTGVDLPAISSSVLTPIQNKSYDVVLDVGGDSVGARVLARYHGYFKEENYDMFCVINANRTGTQNVDASIEHIRAIEKVTGLKVTGLINNTHLLRETSLDDVLKGNEITQRVSRKLDIQIKYVVAIKGIANIISKDIDGEIFPIDMYMREDWM